MPWEEEQDRLTQKARLFLASPEVVFQELKTLSAKTKRYDYRGDSFETALIQRNDPLINLGLACYGTNQEVFKVLYNHSLEPAQDDADAHYKEGLRIGCLSNTTVKWTLHRFKELIGSGEIKRVLTHGNEAEVAALIRNPTIENNLLETLYQRKDIFAQLPEERWCMLVQRSSENERLVTEIKYTDGPDLGFMHINAAVFHLLEIAPVKMMWLRVLYNLLDHLDYQGVHRPKKIDHVLARWATVDDRDYKGEPGSGYSTNLTLKDEFRCLVAALYGGGYANEEFKEFVVYGSPQAQDVALRCAYYGNGGITAKEMEAGYQRDDLVFIFAVLFNGGVYHKRELQIILEGRVSGSRHFLRRYFKNSEQWRKHWGNYTTGPISQELRAEAAELGIKAVEESTPNQTDAIQLSVTNLEKRVSDLATRISELKNVVKGVGIAIAIVIVLLWYMLLWYKF